MVNYLNIFLSFIPIFWLLISLGILKMKSYKACGISMLISVIIAFFNFKMKIEYILQSTVEGTVYALLSICWVIVSALLVYNITLKTGALETIKIMLSNISKDRRIQALIIAFAFGGFLEAVAGFGTAVAIPLGILISMGFKPLKSAILCLVSNTVPVAFGVLGVPISTLSEVTGLEVTKLAYYVCIQLIPFAILLPLVLVYIVTNNIKKIKGVLIVSLLSGVAFAIGQTLTAVYIGIELAAVIGSLCSLIIIIIWCKLIPIKELYFFEDDKENSTKNIEINKKDALIAWTPYILVLILVGIVQILPVLKEKPFLLSKQFYFGDGGKAINFNWITSGGTLLFLSALISGLIQGLKLKDIFIITKDTLKQLKFSILTIVLVVSLAKIMTYSGMIKTSSMFIATISGNFFPFISPLIGTLGTFITGSDTSSNILFGGLQYETALNLNLDEYWITAGNGSGATAGKMISPQSISIASSSVNKTIQESDMMVSTIKYCIIYVLLMGLFIYNFNF